MSLHAPVRIVAACLSLAAGCTDRSLGGDAPEVAAGTSQAILDLLFVIGDTVDMAAQQATLRARFPLLLERLERVASGVEVHVGVTTADLGAPGTDCGYGSGGRLLDEGLASPIGCEALTGAPYLRYVTGTRETNAPDGDASKAFSCMAANGELGCAYQMPLEAMYRVLTSDTSGFLRPDARLAVVLLGDGDDCSVDDPESALFAGGDAPELARCAHHDALAPLGKYEHLIARPRDRGGLKVDPRQIVVATLAAPARCDGHLSTRARLDGIAAAAGHAVRGSLCDADAFFSTLADALAVAR